MRVSKRVEKEVGGVVVVSLFCCCCLSPTIPFLWIASLRRIVPRSRSGTQVGTDIQDNKCSWLVVQALQRATKEQKEVLVKNYAIDEEEKVSFLFRMLLNKIPPKYARAGEHSNRVRGEEKFV